MPEQKARLDNMKDDSIVRRVREAFPPGKPPKKRITAHHCTECDEVDRLLRGRTWMDVAGDFPEYCHDTYPLLTEEARIYYLPAYLVYELRTPGTMAGLSVESALRDGRLLPEPFDRAQREAIVLWLGEYYADEPGGVPPAKLVKRWTPESSE